MTQRQKLEQVRLQCHNEILWLDLTYYLFIAHILMYHRMTHRAEIIILKISEFHAGLTALET